LNEIYNDSPKEFEERSNEEVQEFRFVASVFAFSCF
jgi:hypothetical protein